MTKHIFYSKKVTAAVFMQKILVQIQETGGKNSATKEANLIFDEIKKCGISILVLVLCRI